MKLFKVLAMAALAITLIVGAAAAAPFVGVEGGVSANSTSNTTVNGYTVANPKFNAGGVVGFMGGYDFNDPAFTKTYPWMKYLSVAGDFTWNGFTPTQPMFSNNRVGNQYAVSFLGIAKYPASVKIGQKTVNFAPYVGVGPGVVWSSVGNKSATAAVLVVEPGIKLMVAKQVSLDAAYRFRYSYANFGGTGVGTNVWNNMFLVRANYHF